MFQSPQKSLTFRLIASAVNIFFIISFIAPTPSLAQTPAELGMPVPGSMVSLTAAYVPVIAKGLRVHPENPILFDFIIDTGNSGFKSSDEGLKKESEKLIKYFLASLTTPEKDLWVNLSPYEKDRIIPDQLGQTEMGRDMLAQDYMLKQLTASLIYPEKELGKEFWGQVYAKAQALYGSTEVPVNTFNKVWIVADKAKIYVHENTAFVVASHLKVMLEEDYLAMSKNDVVVAGATAGQLGQAQGPVRTSTNSIGSQIVREIILPELDKEVNSGKNFANLRQIFNSMILATWYKKNLKEALLNQVYSNKNKVAGVDVADKTIKDQIYQEYLKAYKKGVFNYIKEDIDQISKRPVPKKYFSGGIVGDMALTVTKDVTDPVVIAFGDSPATGQMYSVGAATPRNEAELGQNDKAMLTARQENQRFIYLHLPAIKYEGGLAAVFVLKPDATVEQQEEILRMLIAEGYDYFEAPHPAILNANQVKALHINPFRQMPPEDKDAVLANMVGRPMRFFVIFRNDLKRGFMFGKDKRRPIDYKELEAAKARIRARFGKTYINATNLIRTSTSKDTSERDILILGGHATLHFSQAVIREMHEFLSDRFKGYAGAEDNPNVVGSDIEQIVRGSFDFEELYENLARAYNHKDAPVTDEDMKKALAELNIEARVDKAMTISSKSLNRAFEVLSNGTFSKQELKELIEGSRGPDSAIREIASNLSVSYRTVRNKLREIPEFDQAMTISEPLLAEYYRILGNAKLSKDALRTAFTSSRTRDEAINKIATALSITTKDLNTRMKRAGEEVDEAMLVTMKVANGKVSFDGVYSSNAEYMVEEVKAEIASIEADLDVDVGGSAYRTVQVGQLGSLKYVLMALTNSPDITYDRRDFTYAVPVGSIEDIKASLKRAEAQLADEAMLGRFLKKPKLSTVKTLKLGEGIRIGKIQVSFLPSGYVFMTEKIGYRSSSREIKTSLKKEGDVQEFDTFKIVRGKDSLVITTDDNAMTAKAQILQNINGIVRTTTGSNLILLYYPALNPDLGPIVDQMLRELKLARTSGQVGQNSVDGILVTPETEVDIRAKLMGWLTKDEAMTVEMRGLLDKSRGLIARMEAANIEGDLTALDEALEDARVELPGAKKSRPFLFAVGSTNQVPNPVNPSIAEVKTLLSIAVPDITDEEARMIKEKDNKFKFDSVEHSERNGRIYEAALKAGFLGHRHVVTNIKRFSPNSHLAYLQFLQGLANEYNGHVTFLLSVEESPDVLKGDGAGMTTAIEAASNVLGSDFLDHADIDVITDGGLKERGGNWTGKFGYNGLMPTAFGVEYYRRAMSLMGKVRMQHKQFGENRIFWTASDGDYDVGNIGYGQNSVANLENDGSWNMMIHGAEEEIVADSEKEALFAEITRAQADGKWDTIKSSSEGYPLITKAIKKIRDQKLQELGENFADSVGGKMKKFQEKPTPKEILLLLKDPTIDTNRIIPNAFLVVYNREAFKKQQEAYVAPFSTPLEKGEASFREIGGSYFQFGIDGQYNDTIVDKQPPVVAEALRKIHQAMPKTEMLAAGLGSIGRFTDRGKTQFLSDAYWDAIDVLKKAGTKGVVKNGNVRISPNVTLNVLPGATVVLENVVIESDKPVTITLGDYTYLQNSILRLQEDVAFQPRTAIVNSRLNTAFQINGGDVVVIGAIVDGVNAVQDYTAQGSWEVPQALELYPGETYTTILTRDGRRYANRTITKADYKGKPIALALSLSVESAQRLHPRLGFNAVTIVGEFILHPNWQAAPGVNADIKVAKELMDYVGMMREGGLLIKEASQDNALVSVKQPAVDQALTTRREGGINLDSKNLQLDINGEKINIKFDTAMIEQFKKGDFTGVRPVIINITPITNMLPLLGMVRKEETEKLAKV